MVQELWHATGKELAEPTGQPVVCVSQCVCDCLWVKHGFCVRQFASVLVKTPNHFRCPLRATATAPWFVAHLDNFWSSWWANSGKQIWGSCFLSGLWGNHWSIHDNGSLTSTALGLIDEHVDALPIILSSNWIKQVHVIDKITWHHYGSWKLWPPWFYGFMVEKPTYNCGITDWLTIIDR